MTSFWSWVGTIVLLVVGVVGLTMSLCGGFFSAQILGAAGSRGFLVISIPSLLAGLGILWGVSQRLRRRFGAKAER